MERLPVADGGDGTLDAAVAAGFERVAVTATGPTGEQVRTAYAVKDGTAVVEMADVSGLVRLPRGASAPLTATSRGTGEFVAAALDQGVTRVVLGIGGSACTDGGAGLLQALGALSVTATGRSCRRAGKLGELTEIEFSGLHPGLHRAEVVVACDVDNPLTGRSGAAAVYAPQKGATERDVGSSTRTWPGWPTASRGTPAPTTVITRVPARRVGRVRRDRSPGRDPAAGDRPDAGDGRL